MDNRVGKFFRGFRDRQRKIAATGGGALTVYPEGRTEHSYGAPYGEHALSAFVSAKRHVAFIDRLEGTNQ